MDEKVEINKDLAPMPEPKPDADELIEDEDLKMEFMLAEFLRSISYPTTKEQMLGQAKAMGVSQKVIQFIRGLPNGTYDSANELENVIKGDKPGPNADIPPKLNEEAEPGPNPEEQ